MNEEQSVYVKQKKYENEEFIGYEVKNKEHGFGILNFQGNKYEG